MLIRDYNADESKPCHSEFLFVTNAENIVKEPTCYKSLSNPSCTDFVITNSSSSFQTTKTILTGKLDFHKLVVKNLDQKELVHRDYKNFDGLTF